jgi:hypothetical protein
MAAVSTSETSVNFYQIRRHYIPEYSHLHTRRLEDLQSYQRLLVKPDRVLLIKQRVGCGERVEVTCGSKMRAVDRVLRHGNYIAPGCGVCG